MIKNKATTTFICTIVLVCACIFLISSGSAPATSGKTLRVGIPGDPNSISPNNNVSLNAKAVVRQICETLLWLDKDGKIQPRLAVSWEFPDDKSIIFHLRKGVKFHDGTSFDAEAVKFSLERILQEKLKASTMLTYLESIDVVDQHTIKVHVNTVSSVAVSQFALAGWIESPSAIKKFGKEADLHPVGTGPFMFVEWKAHDKITLAAFKDYWAGSPSISNVELKPVPEAQTRIAMLEAGDLDVVMTPPLTSVQWIEGKSGIKVLSANGNLVTYICINLARSPMDNKTIRRAFAHAINREGIVKALLFGKARTANSFVSSDLEYSKKYDLYPYDPKKAVKLLNELGWTEGKKGILEKNGEPFEISLMTPVGRYPMDAQIAQAVQAQLKKIGVKAEVETLESGAFVKWAMQKKEDKQKSKIALVVGAFGRYAELGTALTNIWHSSSVIPNGYNMFFFENEKFDQALNSAKEESEPAKRKVNLEKAQDILYDEMPMIPMYFWPNLLYIKDGVKGVGMPNSSNEFQIFWDATID